MASLNQHASTSYDDGPLTGDTVNAFTDSGWQTEELAAK